MSGNFTPSKGKSEKNYTEMQQYILDNVVTKYGGDPLAAARGAGYSNPYNAVLALREELMDIADNILALNLIKANLKQVEIMESETPVPDSANKLKAALEIRNYVRPKATEIKVEGEIKGGVFILPDKKPLDSSDE